MKELLIKMDNIIFFLIRNRSLTSEEAELLENQAVVINRLRKEYNL